MTTKEAADLRDAMPVRDAAVDVVLASLSLHYFPWDVTVRVFGEVHRVLKDGGRLLFRVNATNDVAHGSLDGEEVEPGLRQIGDRRKRFFDEPDIHAALGGRFDVEDLRHATITRYEAPKRMWECLARVR